ncbi:MAG: hypothetical protein KDB99_08100 [Chitinophagaceae bacterium]|nr:hypothetical protein [Chitinophagaceae bacterium]
MKKSIAAISLICYLTVTCGITINAHYCMERLASVNLFSGTTEVCGQCGMDMHENSGCCRDEVSVVKLTQDQNKIPVTDYTIPAVEHMVFTPSAYLSTLLFDKDVDTDNRPGPDPPLISAQDTYKQINVFLI